MSESNRNETKHLSTEAGAWIKAEIDEITAKEEAVAEKQERLEESRVKLEDMDDFAKLKRARSRIRSAFKQPLKRQERLQAFGDDIAAAVKERLKKYRINRIVQAYGIEHQKFLESIEKLLKLKEIYPVIVEALEYTDVNFEITELRNEDGEFQFLTSQGVYILGKEYIED